MNENELSRIIIGAAIEVHRELGGPGMLESIYEECLVAELTSQGVAVAQQVDVPVTYKGRLLSKHYRIDLLIGNLVVVEVKAIESLLPVHAAQLLTQLRITNKRLGLLINFGQKYVKDGVQRIVNKLH